MLTTNDTRQDMFPGNFKKTALVMSVALGLGGASNLASAALASGTTLSFTLGSVGTVACLYGTTPPCALMAYNVTDIVGSYFSMDTNASGAADPFEKTPISSNNGLILGSTQAASGSHPGSISGAESPGIDNPWTFFGGTGMHQTVGTAPTASNITANGADIDLSGWAVAWNGLANIPMTLLGGAATMSCTGGTSCSDTSAYTLDAAFHVNGAGFTTVGYTVHMEGTVASAAVPVPAAAWLFGSGLMGLAGVARRRKTK